MRAHDMARCAQCEDVAMGDETWPADVGGGDKKMPNHAVLGQHGGYSGRTGAAVVEREKAVSSIGHRLLQDGAKRQARLRKRGKVTGKRRDVELVVSGGRSREPTGIAGAWDDDIVIHQRCTIHDACTRMASRCQRRYRVSQGWPHAALVRSLVSRGRAVPVSMSLSLAAIASRFSMTTRYWMTT